MPAAHTPQPPASGSRWWCEWEVLLLLVLVLGGYFYRASDLPLRGEEPRRSMVAVEMIETGDWVVPRQQGFPFLSRPPLQNWLLALTFLGRSGPDTFGARLPSLIATFLIVLLLYAYGRTFLSRSGALAGAVIYATFGEVLLLGRTAETEAVFTLLVSGSLLLWHWGVLRGWPAPLTWGLGYGLMALGLLTKGPQAPFYFLVTATAYLLLTRQLRLLFTLGHVAGVLIAAAIVAAWAVPFWRQMGPVASVLVWLNDSGPRLFSWNGFLLHLLTFPMELVGCTLPWSPLALLFLRRDIRASVGPAHSAMLFVTIAFLLALPTCWLPPGAKTRYLAPLLPCFALALGFLVQHCGEATADSPLGACWRRYLTAYAVVMLLVAAALPATILARNSPVIASLAGPPLNAAAFALAALGLAWLARRAGWAVVAVAGFTVVFFNGPVLEAQLRRSEDPRAAVAQLDERLPADVRLVSLGFIHSEFPLYSGRRITPLPWPSTSPPAIGQGDYFCYNTSGFDRLPLPFAWEEVAVISLDRNRHLVPENALVVGRRLPSP